MTILVSACGSSIGLEVARSLKMAGRSERVIGSEVSWWGKQLGERFCDEVFLLPRGDQPGYVDALVQLLRDQQVKLLLVNTDPELEAIEPVRTSSRSLPAAPLRRPFDSASTSSSCMRNWRTRTWSPGPFRSATVPSCRMP